VLGFLKSFAIPAEELERAFEHGVTFDGSAIEGFARQREDDLVAKPNPMTLQLLPWGPEPKTAGMFCDVYTPDGERFSGDSRGVLRRQLLDLSTAGMRSFVGPEIEFFLFADEKGTEPLDQGTYFDVTTMDASSDFRRTVIRYLEQLGIPVEESHHEVAASQHEIDLRFADALTMADSIMTFRLTVKEAAREFGIYATFMPKPIQGAWGSGMHLHLALWDEENNALAGDDPSGLSPAGKAFVAGILQHARGITAVTNQWVNSYKRLIPGYEAPVFVCWGRHARSALVRVPPARDGQTRIEIRSPDPACNPYLALAVIIAAGLDGVRTGAALPPESPDDLESMSNRERLALDIRPLPDSLAEALSEMERSELVRSVLGDDLVAWFVRNKMDEWREYRAQVTPFEVGRYLPML
jgi:glutamine synthetase